MAESRGLEPLPRINWERFSKPPQCQLCLTLHISGFYGAPKGGHAWIPHYLPNSVVVALRNHCRPKKHSRLSYDIFFPCSLVLWSQGFWFWDVTINPCLVVTIPRFELGFRPWKGRVLYQLDDSARWSGWQESNLQPADYKAAALPIELHQRSCQYFIHLLKYWEWFYYYSSI